MDSIKKKRGKHYGTVCCMPLLMPVSFSKVLSVAVYNHYNRLRLASLKKSFDTKSAKNEDDDENDCVEPEKSNLLLIGPTGSGMIN